MGGARAEETGSLLLLLWLSCARAEEAGVWLRLSGPKQSSALLLLRLVLGCAGAEQACVLLLLLWLICTAAEETSSLGLVLRVAVAPE